MSPRLPYLIAILLISTAAMPSRADTPPLQTLELELEAGPMDDWIWSAESGPASGDVVAERWQWTIVPWVELAYLY